MVAFGRGWLSYYEFAALVMWLISCRQNIQEERVNMAKIGNHAGPYHPVDVQVGKNIKK